MLNYKARSIKVRRIFAFLLDFIFCLFIDLVVIVTITCIMGATGNIDSMDNTLVESLLNKTAILFLLRDFLCGGTSLGKRIFALRVVDFNTHKKPAVLKQILRTVFVIILAVDAITMFIEGRSIGDRVANTMVVSKRNILHQTNH